VVFDDWFATVSTSVDKLPNSGSDPWNELFGDSEFQYVLDELDAQLQPMEATKTASRSAEIATAMDHVIPPRQTSNPSHNSSHGSETVTSLKLKDSPPPPQRGLVSLQQREPESSQEKQLISTAPTLAPPAPENDQGPTLPKTPDIASGSLQRHSSTSLTTENTVKGLRRSGRQVKAPAKHTYDVLGDSSPGLQAHFTAYLARTLPEIDMEMASVYNANNQDPDLLNYDQAMSCEHAERERWIQAAITEMEQLEKMDCWEEVQVTEATGKILPGTWAFRRKRTPDGEIKKWKGRFCVRDDLQEGDFETFAPLVACATVRLFLVLSLVLEWKTVSVDFAIAFVQALLRDPIWIHIPRGCRSRLGQNTCLRLKKSLYGLAIAPRLWYKYEHLFEALLHPDFGLT
jgi:hypothetical protein